MTYRQHPIQLSAEFLGLSESEAARHTESDARQAESDNPELLQYQMTDEDLAEARDGFIRGMAGFLGERIPENATGPYVLVRPAPGAPEMN